MTTPAKKAFKKVREKSVNWWKKKAWKVFSEYIRKRDADDDGFARCITCGAVKHWKNGDAGHFLEGRNNSILFDERGVHFQCKGCNGNLRDGNISRNKEKTNLAYEKFMLQKYGPKVVQELREKRTQTRQFSVPELKELIRIYEEKIKDL